MNHKMTSTIKNHKKGTVLVAITALAAVLAVSAVAIGSGHMALAGNVTNTGINFPTDTNQKQECETAGGSSPVKRSCTATSTDSITASGVVMGELKK